MSQKSRVPQSEIAAIAARLRDGVAVPQIASDLGIEDAAMLRLLGSGSSPLAGDSRQLSAAQRAHAQLLVRERSWSPSNAAKIYGADPAEAALVAKGSEPAPDEIVPARARQLIDALAAGGRLCAEEAAELDRLLYPEGERDQVNGTLRLRSGRHVAPAWETIRDVRTANLIAAAFFPDVYQAEARRALLTFCLEICARVVGRRGRTALQRRLTQFAESEIGRGFEMRAELLFRWLCGEAPLQRVVFPNATRLKTGSLVLGSMPVWRLDLTPHQLQTLGEHFFDAEPNPQLRAADVRSVMQAVDQFRSADGGGRVFERRLALAQKHVRSAEGKTGVERMIRWLTSDVEE